ncbi:oligosaccharide flippase family protein, partial [Longimicrobium sp.]|uniref:oligosaccharide flippase family protein n=1 Tax=Longimicrobium sp. TaxID=2029185 RepID=UPI002F9230C5
MPPSSPPPRAAPAGRLPRWLPRWLPPGSNRRGIAYTLAGAGIPAALALAAIPRIASGLGPERFGVLILAWTVVGYAALLQLGLGRAVARHASAERRRDSRVLAPVVWTALAISGALGAAAAGALFVFAAPIARGIHVPPAMASEAASAFRLLALALPFTVTAPVLGGVLEARRRFGLVNAVAMPTAALTYLGPVAALALAPGLVPVVGVLCAARVASWCALAALCAREIPRLRTPRMHRRLVKPLLAYGGWATVSAIVSPLLVYLDRFVVAGMASAAAAAYYGTGQEVALRLGIASGAVVTVLFPAFAAVPRRDGARLGQLLERGVAAVALL